MKMKFCNKCKTLKNIDEFYKRGNGHCSHCKECMKENNRQWHLKNQEKAKERRNKWHKEQQN